MRLYATLRDLGDVEADAGAASPYLTSFQAALDDDLNTPAAFAELFRLARAARQETSPAVRGALKTALVTAGGSLGLLQQPPSDWFAAAATAGRTGPIAMTVEQGEIEALVAERREARGNRDFGQADRLRDRLTSLGIVVEDQADRTAWRRASSS